MPVYKDEKHKTKDGRKWFYKCQYIEVYGNRKTKLSKMYATKDEATKEEAKFKSQNNTEFNNTSKLTLKNTFDLYMKNECELKNKESSCYNYDSIYRNNLAPHFEDGNKIISDISLKDIQKWKNIIDSQNYSLKHKKRMYVVFSNIIGYAVKMGELKENYVKRVGNFLDRNDEVKKEKKIRYQTIDEFNQFIEVVDELVWKAFFTFTFWQGCRKGELQALQWEDIDFNKSMVTINKTFSDKVRNGGNKITNTKNRRDRKIDILEQTIPILKQLHNEYKKLDGYTNKWYVFGGITYLPKTSIDNKLKQYYIKLENKLKTENIKKLTHHEFGRHSHASLMLELGATTYDIALRLGDTEEVIRETYIHPYMDQRSKKVRELFKEK